MKTFNKLLSLIIMSITFAQADFKSDLTAINTAVLDLNQSTATTTISSESMCAVLVALDQQAHAIVATIKESNANMSAPLSVDSELLDQVDTLIKNVASLSGTSLGLSTDIVLVAPTTDALTLKDGITTMLQLSSEIGEMADRIGEMADNILVMADNIGLMADRIIITQEIQSTNLATTQSTVLQTQTNMLSVVSITTTSDYTTSLGQLIIDADLLAIRMNLVAFNQWTMDNQLEDVKEDVSNYLAHINTFKALIDADNLTTTNYIDSNSLTQLTALSVMMTSFAASIDMYVGAIQTLQYFTRDSVLEDSMASMLTLSSDINAMSNAIMEMADGIIVSSDNIGLVADEIVLSQTAQSANIVLTQSSMLAAQSMAVAILADIN
jgi:hypothetical protein